MKGYTLAASLFFASVLPVVSQVILYKAELTLLEAPSSPEYTVGDKYEVQITYNDTQLTGVGDEFLTFNNGLQSLNFVFNGVSYDHTFDTTNNYPRMFLTNGTVTGIDFWNTVGITGASPDSFFRFFRDGSFLYSHDGSSEFDGSYLDVTPAPEPRYSMFFTAALGYGLMRRRRK